MALTQQTHGLPVSQGALSSSSRINETVELKSTRLVLGRNPRDSRFAPIFTVLVVKYIFVSVMSQRHEPEANVAGVMSPIFLPPHLHLNRRCLMRKEERFIGVASWWSLRRAQF